MRRLLAAAACAALTACGGDAPVASPRPVATAPPTAAPTPAVTAAPTPVPTARVLRAGDFDATRAMAHVRAFGVEIGKREAGSDGDRRAQAYLAGRLRALGYEVELDRFDLPQGGTSVNVIGRPPGWDPSQRHVIVGGHFDSLGGPGANDNGSGMGVVLEIARDVRVVPAALPVLVIAFGAEETQPAPGRPHHVGSRHYVASMGEQERRSFVSFVNLDQVGRGPEVILGRLRTGPREGTERLVRLARELGIRHRVQVTPDWSDNGSFLRRGLNAGWLWTGIDPGHYHNPADTIDRIQVGALDRTGSLALAALRSYR